MNIPSNIFPFTCVLQNALNCPRGFATRVDFERTLKVGVKLVLLKSIKIVPRSMAVCLISARDVRGAKRGVNN